jgi:hypothetical protein
MIGNEGKCGSLAFLERRTMSLLEWTRDPVGQLKKYAELGKICVEEVGRFDDCDRVWAVIGIVLAVVCLVALGFIARHFYREYAGHRRVRQRRLAELGVADSEVMSEYVWSGEKALEHGLSQEEVLRRIKDAKTKQRAGGQNKSAGDPALGARDRHS